MAKGKERPTGNNATSKAAAPRSAAGPKSAPERPAKSAPDAPTGRPADGRASGTTAARLSPEEVYKLIQESAYFKAKARGFAPGHEVQDWIEAEAEVRRRLGDRPS